jgi:phosphatidylinositol-bisphosphatase
MSSNNNSSKSIFYGHDPGNFLMNGIASVIDPFTSSSSSNSSSSATLPLAASASLTPASSSSNNLPGLESVVQSQLKLRESEYVDLKQFRITCATWNVNGKPCVESLKDWLTADPIPPDVYAIGFQELDLSKEAFLFTDSPREEEWFVACSLALLQGNPGVQFIELKRIRLIGMMMIVFVKREIMDMVTNVTAESVGTGLLGRMGNKGGVAIRFDLCHTSVCFVNSHLAAHFEEVERRNQDYNEINNRLVFTNCKPYPKMIADHDQIYWFGDLNYRITSNDAESVKKLITVRDFESLHQLDQLNMELGKDHRKVFVGFREGDINFMPTYKYDPGTDNWDSSEKSRPPAWTDRVLYFSTIESHIQQVSYNSHPSLRSSDHKPVTAVFQSMIKVMNDSKWKSVYQDVMKRLDKIENELLPQVSVNRTDVSFGDVYFRTSTVKYLTVKNTGQIGVTFSFLKKPNQSSYCKDWLRVKPHSSRIDISQSVDIELEIFVDKKSASKLNYGSDTLSDILVLHLEHGRDLFITISGNYKPSVFGSSIEFLVRLSTPIADMSLDQVISRMKSANESVNDLLDFSDETDDGKKVWDIPQQIWILVDHLFRKGMKSLDSLFVSQGMETEVQMIREALDHGKMDELHCSIHSVAESLLMLLESFHEPVIPYALFNKSLDGSHNFAACQEVSF